MGTRRARYLQSAATEFAAKDTRTTEPLPELFKHRGRGTEIDI